MWDLSGPGIEPVSHVLAGGFLTTGPPGKPCSSAFKCLRKIYSLVRWGCHKKIPQSGLNSRNLLFTVLEAGVWDQSAAWSGSGWQLSSWLQMATVSLCPHAAFPRGVRWMRKRSLSSSSCKEANPIKRAPPSRLKLTLITSERPHLQIASRWELRLQHMDFRGTKAFSH